MCRIEKRSQFLERIAAMLALRGRGDFIDGDVGAAVFGIALLGRLLEKCRTARS